MKPQVTLHTMRVCVCVYLCAGVISSQLTLCHDHGLRLRGLRWFCLRLGLRLRLRGCLGVNGVWTHVEEEGRGV